MALKAIDHLCRFIFQPANQHLNFTLCQSTCFKVREDVCAFYRIGTFAGEICVQATIPASTSISMAFLERTYLFGAPLSAFVTDLPTNPFSALLPWSKHRWVCSMAEETPIKTADFMINLYPDFEAELEEETGHDPSAPVVTKPNQGTSQDDTVMVEI